MNLVLYRKYRPANFSQIVGQKHIVQTLKNATKENRLAHAYLFCGPRGTGKTSFARILSKAANCQKLQEGDICNKCESCLNINKQRALDIVEIDAASNTGVDNIRDIIENVKFKPNQLKRKVFIIDEVHMLSKGAFNALLKTLEEPPSHAMFVLATTEIEKVPETILSRVQRFDVKKLSDKEIEDKLSFILKKENVKADKEAIKLIAQLAEGGLRDAESILSRILSSESKKIDRKSVENISGVSNFKKIYDFLNLVSKKDAKNIIIYLNSLEKEGVDMTIFLKSIMRHIRNLLFLKISPELKSLMPRELTEEQIKDMIDQSSVFEEEILKKLLSELLKAEENLKKTSLTLLPIELAILNSIF